MNNLTLDKAKLAIHIKSLAKNYGFSELKITDLDLSEHRENLKAWLDKGYHGDMEYMQEHFEMRLNPKLLMPNIKRVLVVRMDYMPPSSSIIPVLNNPELGAISRYALGKDYHKLIRKRLKKLCDEVQKEIGPFTFRPFADSAPVSEKPLGEKAGLGFIGKNTLLINRKAGSYFFIGTVYTDLELPIDEPSTKHCGSCTACIRQCPTDALNEQGQIDARKCISYLTIENKKSIPIEFRKKMGNRIFGCDDCQIVCPFNKFSKPTDEDYFQPRHNLESPNLIELFLWTEEEFKLKTQNSPIKRATYPGWLRNVAVALGNAPHNKEIVDALKSRLHYPNPIVKEHVEWALSQQRLKTSDDYIHHGDEATRDMVKI